MKKIIILLSIFSLSLPNLFAAKTIDKMLAIIYHPEGDIPVIQSDLIIGFEGKKTLDSEIFNQHVELDGAMLKVDIEEEDVNRHLVQVQKANNMTKEDTVKYARSMGLGYERFKDELRKALLRERVMGYRMKGSHGIDKETMIAYHQDNPVYKETIYTIKQTSIPYGSNSPSLMKIRIEDAIANGTIESIVKWSDPVELKESQIAADKNFIKTLEIGKSAIANTTDQGVSLIQLSAKDPSRMMTFEEREPEIKNILMQSKQEKAFNDYKNKLYSSSSIKYIN